MEGNKNQMDLIKMLAPNLSEVDSNSTRPLQQSSTHLQTPTNNKNSASASHRAGDWICIRCNNLNYSFRLKCNRCQVQTKKQNILDGLTQITDPSNGDSEVGVSSFKMPVPFTHHQMNRKNENGIIISHHYLDQTSNTSSKMVDRNMLDFQTKRIPFGNITNYAFPNSEIEYDSVCKDKHVFGKNGQASNVGSNARALEGWTPFTKNARKKSSQTKDNSENTSSNQTRNNYIHDNINIKMFDNNENESEINKNEGPKNISSNENESFRGYNTVLLLNNNLETQKKEKNNIKKSSLKLPRINDNKYAYITPTENMNMDHPIAHQPQSLIINNNDRSMIETPHSPVNAKNITKYLFDSEQKNVNKNDKFNNYIHRSDEGLENKEINVSHFTANNEMKFIDVLFDILHQSNERDNDEDFNGSSETLNKINIERGDGQVRNQRNGKLNQKKTETIYHHLKNIN